MVTYIPYPKAIKSLVDRLNATPEELAAWIWMGPKINGLAAYLNANGLESPPIFHYDDAFCSKDSDYISPLMACWFNADDIANFKPVDRYITGITLIERWKTQPGIQPKAFIQAKIGESRLNDHHPIYGGTKGSSPGRDFPPLESGLFLLAEIELIEIEEFGCILLNIPEPVTISNTDANKLKKTSDFTIFHTMEGLSFKEIIIRIDPENLTLRISARKAFVTTSFNSLGFFKKNGVSLNAQGEIFLTMANGNFSPEQTGAIRAQTRLSKLLRKALKTEDSPFIKHNPQYRLTIPKYNEAKRRAKNRSFAYNENMAIPSDASAQDFLEKNDPQFDLQNPIYLSDDELA